ncbi:ATP-binding protein [Streptomyces sp. NPDC046805]|uniref:sensor histidine kinase n=1 Tax=Streptomyces sp. NPDC046805 TaxID=3155134 RepID=UPI0033E47AF1
MGDLVVRAVSSVRQAISRIFDRRSQRITNADALATEVHNTMAHSLTLISLHLQLVSKKVVDSSVGHELRHDLALMHVALNKAWTDLQNLLRSLSNENGGGAAQRNQVEHVKGLVAVVDHIGIPVALDIYGAPPDVPPAIGSAMYGIVQEALTNAIKHSPQGSARVAITFADDEVHLEVTDDGVRDARMLPLRGSGRGLQGLQNRAAFLGGEVSAGRDPHGGYRVMARLPLTDDDSRNSSAPPNLPAWLRDQRRERAKDWHCAADQGKAG